MLPLEIKSLILDLHSEKTNDTSISRLAKEQRDMFVSWLLSGLSYCEIYTAGSLWAQNQELKAVMPITCTSYIQASIPTECKNLITKLDNRSLGFKKLAFLVSVSKEEDRLTFDPFFTQCKFYGNETPELTGFLRRDDLKPNIQWESSFMLVSTLIDSKREDMPIPNEIDDFTSSVVKTRIDTLLNGHKLFGDIKYKASIGVRGLATCIKKDNKHYLKTVVKLEETFTINIKYELPSLESDHDRLSFLAAY